MWRGTTVLEGATRVNVEELVVVLEATRDPSEPVLVRVVDDRVHRSIFYHSWVSLSLHPELNSFNLFFD